MIIRIFIFLFTMLSVNMLYAEIIKVEKTEKGISYTVFAKDIKAGVTTKDCIYVDRKDLADQKYMEAWKIDTGKIVVDSVLKAQIDTEVLVKENKLSIEERLTALETK